MYDVQPFIKAALMNPERSGEYAGGESQNLEFFRRDRNASFVAEKIRETLGIDQWEPASAPPGRQSKTGITGSHPEAPTKLLGI